MELSSYQSQILDTVGTILKDLERPDFIPTSPKSKAIVIQALAGSGKSTQLVLICKLLAQLGISSEQVFLSVFGKKNKADLASKLKAIGPGWESSVSTLHSIGYRIYRSAIAKAHKSIKVSDFKYKNIGVKLGYFDDPFGDGKGNIQEVADPKDFESLINFLRQHLLDPTPENILYLSNLYNLEVYNPRVVASCVANVLAEGIVQAVEWNKPCIDMEDMIWIPCEMRRREENSFIHAFKNNSKNLRVLMVDELQDSSACQIAMMQYLAHDRCLTIGVGDAFQAVYGFRGCLSNGMEVIANSFDSTSLPLPINYRCGRVHLDLVNEIFPYIQIQPSPRASEGRIELISTDKFIDIFADISLSYLCIARKNVSLIGGAIQCLKAGIPARIKDRDLGKTIQNKVKAICKGRPYSPDTFSSSVQMYLSEQITFLQARNKPEGQILVLQDMMDAILTLFNTYQPQTLKDWERIVDEMFKESGHNPVNFYTIHSGKGAEADISVVLYPEDMPLCYRGQTPEEYQQENNLIYVALTRTLARQPKGGILYLVTRSKHTIPVWLEEPLNRLLADRLVLT